MPEEFEMLSTPFVDGLQELISDLPDKGDTAETSQKVLLQYHLNQLQYAVNGLTEEDFNV